MHYQMLDVIFQTFSGTECNNLEVIVIYFMSFTFIPTASSVNIPTVNATVGAVLAPLSNNCVLSIAGNRRKIAHLAGVVQW
jgi:hypothetical protein